MQLSKVLGFCLLHGTAFAAQDVVDINPKITSTTTVVVPVTYTVYSTVQPSTSSSDSSAASIEPTETPVPVYGLRAARTGASFHLQPINAAGFNFYIGGSPATYCPTFVDQCPNTNVTAIVGSGSMDVEVPGGQQVFVAPDGHLGYTQAHSASYPEGAVLSPLVITIPANQTYGYVTTHAFNAPGFMACPNTNGIYQVFAAIANATVPGGDVSSCLGFVALASGFHSIAAWQYV